MPLYLVHRIRSRGRRLRGGQWRCIAARRGHDPVVCIRLPRGGRTVTGPVSNRVAGHRSGCEHIHAQRRTASTHAGAAPACRCRTCLTHRARCALAFRGAVSYIGQRERSRRGGCRRRRLGRRGFVACCRCRRLLGRLGCRARIECRHVIRLNLVDDRRCNRGLRILQRRRAQLGRGHRVRLTHNQQLKPLAHRVLRPAALQRIAGCHLLGCGLRNRQVHRRKPLLRVLGVGRRGVLHYHRAIGCRGLAVVLLFQLGPRSLRHLHLRAHHPGLRLVRIADPDQRVVHVAEQRIGVHHRLVPGNRGRVVGMGAIELPQIELALAQDLLHIAQLLRGLRQHRLGRIRIGLQHRAVLVLRLDRFGVIPIRHIHLLQVDVAHAHLRFGSFRGIWKKCNEVPVFLFGLRHRRRSALLEPAIRIRQLRAHQVLRIRIGAHQRLQIQPRYVEVALLLLLQRLVVQPLVRKILILADQRVVFLCPAHLGLGVLALDRAIFLRHVLLGLLIGVLDRSLHLLRSGRRAARLRGLVLLDPLVLLGRGSRCVFCLTCLVCLTCLRRPARGPRRGGTIRRRRLARKVRGPGEQKQQRSPGCPARSAMRKEVRRTSVHPQLLPPAPQAGVFIF